MGNQLRIPLGGPWWRVAVVGAVLIVVGVVVILVGANLNNSGSWLAWLLGILLILAGCYVCYRRFVRRMSMTLDPDQVRFSNGVVIPWWTIESVGLSADGRDLGFRLNNRQPFLASLEAQQHSRNASPIIRAHSHGPGQDWDALLPAALLPAGGDQVVRQILDYRAAQVAR